MIPQAMRGLPTARPFAFLILCSCLALNARGQDKPAAEFKFTKVDSQIFDDANEFDHQLEKKGLVLENPDLQAYLDSVGKRVVGVRPVPEQVEFHFRALRDPMVNAFALPNGSVYVTTGLLSLLENEAQLAAVLGHETSHVFDRHTYFENRSIRRKAVAIEVLQGAAAVAPVGSNFGAGAQAFGAAVQLGAMLGSNIVIATVYGYSREMERQADHDGLTAMLSANYDPQAMAQSFELLDEDQKLEFEPIQGFYHDHPKLTERRQAALEFASAHPLKDSQPGSEKEYLEKVAPAICYNVEADIDSRRERTAVARATRLATAMPDVPKYQVLLADAYRSLGAKTALPSEDELTSDGQAEDRKEFVKMTEQEQQKLLLKKPGGEATLSQNLGKAEKLDLGVIQHDPSYAEAYRDLGFLYEQEGKYAAAAAQYGHYLELAAGTSIDRLRIERRLASAQKLANPGQPSPQ